jgi:hypothetical protein
MGLGYLAAQNRGDPDNVNKLVACDEKAPAWGGDLPSVSRYPTRGAAQAEFAARGGSFGARARLDHSAGRDVTRVAALRCSSGSGAPAFSVWIAMLLRTSRTIGRLSSFPTKKR